jgi:hypothetical protein
MSIPQEDQVSRLTATISNLKAGYEAVIRDLQGDLADANATVSELNQENEELAQTLKELDKECSEMTLSLESLMQKNQDLVRYVDQLIQERDELTEKLKEKDNGSDTPEQHADIAAVGSSRHDDQLTHTIEDEKIYNEKLCHSNKLPSKKQNSYDTLETFYSSEASLPSKVESVSSCFPFGNTCSDQSSSIRRSTSQPTMSDSLLLSRPRNKMSNQSTYSPNHINHIEVAPVQYIKKNEGYDSTCIKGAKRVGERLIGMLGGSSILFPNVRSADSLLVDFGKRSNLNTKRTNDTFSLSR